MGFKDLFSISGETYSHIKDIGKIEEKVDNILHILNSKEFDKKVIAAIEEHKNNKNNSKTNVKNSSYAKWTLIIAVIGLIKSFFPEITSFFYFIKEHI